MRSGGQREGSPRVPRVWQGSCAFGWNLIDDAAILSQIRGGPRRRAHHRQRSPARPGATYGLSILGNPSEDMSGGGYAEITLRGEADIVPLEDEPIAEGDGCSDCSSSVASGSPAGALALLGLVAIARRRRARGISTSAARRRNVGSGGCGRTGSGRPPNMTHVRPSWFRCGALAAASVLLLGVDDCAQSVTDDGPPTAGGHESAPDTHDPFDPADEELPPASTLVGDCAPVAWLACGDGWSGSTADPNAGATNVIDFWDVAVGNYRGPEIALAFRPGTSGEATVRFVNPDPNEVNLDVFVIRGSDECRSEDVFGRGFNSLDFEATGGQTHFLVVDGFDGDAGAFELELECDLGGSEGPPGPATGCPLDMDVPGAVESILSAHGVAEVDRSVMPGQTMLQQEYPNNEVCFEPAFDAAIESWLRDGSDVESPLALVEEIDEGPCLQTDPTERVRCFMNQPHSRVDIIVPGGPHPAEHGEAIADHWVFFLDLPALSDHLYWAVVPRDGSAVRTYGFN